MLYALVHILDAPYHIDKPYTYNLPTQLEKKVKVGSIVVVPFGGGNKHKLGVVTQLADKTDVEKTKPVLGVPGGYMYIDSEMLGICMYMKEQLFCSLGDAVSCVLPSGLGVSKVKVYSVTDKKITKDINVNASALYVSAVLIREKSVSETRLSAEFGRAAISCMRFLEKEGYCTSTEEYECKVNEKNEKYVCLVQDEKIARAIAQGDIKLTPKQNSVFEILLHYEAPCPIAELCDISGAGVSVVNEIVKKGVARFITVDYDRNQKLLNEYSSKHYDNSFTLSEMQKNALEQLVALYETHEAKCALLYGVTGSGKTNVMLKLIEKVLSDGKKVIMLVPEIALTSQTVGRFKAYFGDSIALVHSGLGAGERMDAYKAIVEDRAKIVIGTRSAVFAPVKNLGLIIMDEEQESSFKSDKSPKFHARDIARYRCAHNNAMLLLASATPSIDSFYRAKNEKYTLVSLTERYKGLELPEVMFHDMRSEPYFEMENDDGSAVSGGIPTTIGATLEAELCENLVNGEQSILFINRRGFRSFAQCHSCGTTFKCPNCSVTLTHHRNNTYSRDTMTCHYCGHSEPMPSSCPSCGKSESIVYMGAGTQLLEQQLKSKFPEIRVLRMDADTTSGKFSHEEILERFRKGQADVLVGTQMVAKGHDFPKVSLVGVINADTSLYNNDFRANEKTFSLITQVLGRSGRSGKRGRAVIQTYNPENDVLTLCSKQDYTAFYEREIAFRKASLFPPFCDIITLNISGMVETDVINAAKELGKGLHDSAKNDYPDVKFILYGPFRNEVYKLSGKYRMRYIIKCGNNKRTRQMLSELIKKYSGGLKNVSINADVNPQSL